MHGTKDAKVSFSWISDFVEKLNNENIDCIFEPYKDRSHGFFNKYKDNNDYLDTIKKIEEFLEFREF